MGKITKLFLALYACAVCLPLYAERRNRSLHSEYARLEDAVLAGGPYEQAALDCIAFIGEYTATEYWKYVSLHDSDAESDIAYVREQTLRLTGSETVEDKALALGILLDIRHRLDRIAAMEDSQNGRASFVYIIIVLVSLILLVGMIAFISLYLRKSSEADRLKEENYKNKLISSITLKTQEEERARIHRELHDTVSQNMRAIQILFSQLLPFIMDSERSDSLKDRIEKLVQTNIDDIRSIIRNSAPPDIENEDFSLSIEGLCRSFSSCYEIPCKFFVQNADDAAVQEKANSFSVRKKLYIYRIIQEALNNTAKHASPSETSVIVRYAEQSVIFFVTDDGCGFNRDRAMGDESHMGLRGMEFRAAEINAVLSVSSDEDGTEIRLEVPYE